MGEAYLYITCLFKHSSYYSTMPKYFCDYCDTHLTHNSPSVRKTHCGGRKHKDNVRMYYQMWVEEQAQHVIDAATKAYKMGKMGPGPFPGGPPMRGAAIPPPGIMGPRPPMGMGPPGMMGPPGFRMGNPSMMGPPMGFRPGFGPPGPGGPGGPMGGPPGGWNGPPGMRPPMGPR